MVTICLKDAEQEKVLFIIVSTEIGQGFSHVPPSIFSDKQLDSANYLTASISKMNKLAPYGRSTLRK